VFIGRTRPLPAKHEPTLLIYTRTEASERTVRGAPPKIERRVTLHVEGRTSTASDPDDLLDQIAGEIEAGMAAMIDYGRAIFFGGLVQNVQYTATEILAEADGDRVTGGVRLEYLITYRTVEGAPTVVA
jgi:hypothetical protein